MRYRDSIEKSAEYLRLALPLMAKQSTALHPISYAVWYEYVTGANTLLNTSVDELREAGGILDEETTAALYRKHIAELDEDAAKRVTDGFQRILTEVASSANSAGDQASRFGASLEQWSEELIASATGSDLNSGVNKVLRDTQQMQTAIGSLKNRLEESQREVEQLRQDVMRARQDALSDGLTGLTNRKGFDLALAACLSASSEGSQELSLLVTDIDHFKRVNDTYGHLFGDKVIRVVADILKANVKGKDLAARYGGEEFVVLLQDTPLEGARILAEKIRATIANSRIRRLDSNETLEKVTVSIGVGSYRRGESIVEFVGRTDSALYAAKSQGRNQVTVAAAA